MRQQQRVVERKVLLPANVSSTDEHKTCFAQKMRTILTFSIFMSSNKCMTVPDNWVSYHKQLYGLLTPHTAPVSHSV